MPGEIPGPEPENGGSEQPRPAQELSNSSENVEGNDEADRFAEEGRAHWQDRAETYEGIARGHEEIAGELSEQGEHEKALQVREQAESARNHAAAARDMLADVVSNRTDHIRRQQLARKRMNTSLGDIAEPWDESKYHYPDNDPAR